MTRRVPRLTLRPTAKAARRLRVESLEDRTVPSFTVAPSFPVGPGGGNGFKPVAVAVGDFNGDGIPDVATANQDTHNTVGVLLGNGNGTFQPGTTLTIGRQPAFIKAADVNADGKLDLVTANKADNSVSVLLGNGDGTFQAAATYAVGASTGPVALDVADLNGDGKVDLAVADGGANTVTLMLGDGNGGFTAAAQTVAVNPDNKPTAVAIADFNGDGLPDIATVSGGFGHLNVNLNTGGGMFGPTANFATGFCANGLTVGDFNHDGKADVAVACVFPSDDGVSVLMGNGDGTFQPFAKYNAGNQTPGYIITGDLNGDGNADLITANFSSTIQFANNSISILPGHADGTFGTARVYYGGAGPLGVAVGDFNGDGHQDVVTADGGGANGTVSLLAGRGDGTLKASEGLAVSQPGPIAPIDADGDGKVDLAVVTSAGLYQGVAIFQNLGGGQFAPQAQTPAVSGASSVAVADFNGDGHPDLAVTGWDGVSILLNNGDGSFGFPTAYAASGINNWVSVGDFNLDGKADLAVGSSDKMKVLLGNGDGTFQPGTVVDAGGGVNHIAVADLNGDGKPDLAVVNTSTVTVVMGNGDGTFGTPTSLTAGTPDSVSVGDFNNDGHPDLVCTSFIPPGGGGSAVLVWLNDGSGGFPAFTRYLTDSFGSNPIGSAVTDLDQDGTLDVVAANDFSDTLSVFTGTGTGSFNPQSTLVVGDRPTWVAVADVTGDGRPDLAIVNSNSGSVTVIGSTPHTATHFQLHAVPASATAGDTFQVTITALDDTGNPVPDYMGTVSLSSDDAQGVLPPAYTFALTDGGSHTFDVSLRTAGSHTVSIATDFGTLSAPVQVDAAAADHLQFDSPTATTAGDSFDVTVTAFDPFGNVATGFTGTVQFTSTDPNVAAGIPADYTFTAADAGVHTFSGGVTFATAGPQTVSVSTDGLDPLASQLTVSPAAATRLTLGAPVSTHAGTAFNVTVTAYDPYGNVATGFTGTVAFDTTDPIGDLPADYTFTGSDQGVHTFQVTLKQALPQTVSVAAAGLTAAQQSGITVIAGAAAKLVFVAPPANTFPNLAIPTPVTVQIQDQFGNPVSDPSQVSLSLAFGPARSKLKGVLFALPDANGLVTFPKVMFTKPGTYKLMASSALGTTPASDPITVYGATHFKVKITSTVLKPTAGDTVTISVTALDAHNKPDPTYTGTVHFTATDLQALLPADYTFTATDAGQHSFDVVLKKAGVTRITLNDQTKVRMKARLAVTVVAGAATQFAVTTFPLSAKANRAYAFTVTALDQFGNQAKGYVGTVTISSTGSVTIAGTGPTYTFTAANRGRHVFRATFTQPGTGLSLTVTDQADGTITGTETGITVV
jgi:hypothetical protein